MEAFIAAGWSPNALMSVLSPASSSGKIEDRSSKRLNSENSHPNVFSDFLSEAGWSPDALLAAISPLPSRNLSSKRCNKWATPDSANVSQRKSADTKKTPCSNAFAAQCHIIDLRSPPKHQNSDCEIIELSSKLEGQSISSVKAEPPGGLVTQPKFQTAKKLFDDDNSVHSKSTSLSCNITKCKEERGKTM